MRRLADAVRRTWSSRLAKPLRTASDAVVLRPVHAGLYAFAAGLLCARVPVIAVVLGAATVGLGVLAVRVTPRTEDPERRAVVRRGGPVAALIAVLLLAGVIAGEARIVALERTSLAADFGHAITETVVVTAAPRRSSFGGWYARVSLRDEPVLLRMSADRAPLPRIGALLAVQGSVRRPGEFAALLHAHAELRAARADPAGRRGGLAGALDGVRLRAERALDRGLPPAAAGLFRGMVLGEDDALPDATRDAFRAAGLSHLVAASGTNVVLLAALAMAVGTALGLGLTGRLWLVLALIALYVPLAGGGASIQRAGIMGAAAVAAGLVGRPASRWYALGLAVAATLLLDPRAAGDPGWQLSFAAVLSLLVLAPRWRAALVQHGAPPALADVTAMTAAATLATAPIVAAHFDQASLAAIPANLLAAPAVAPVMWLGVAAATLGQLPGLGQPLDVLPSTIIEGLDGLAGYPLGYLTWIGTTAGRAPGAVVEAGVLPVLLGVLAVLALAFSSRVRRTSPALAVLGAAAWLGLAPAAAAPPAPPRGFRLTLLDVGQGDATLLQDGHRAVLVDAGLPDAGIVRLLHRAGISRLDVVVATHADTDHVGGVAAVVSSFPVGLVLDGRDGVRTDAGQALEAAARARGVRVVVGRVGQELRLGALRLRVLWPRPEPAAAHAGANPNERAIVLDVAARGARVLLAADAESEVLARLDLPAVDVLKVSHHGSADPGLPRILERLRPQIAGIEVGDGNTYGHPAPSTLAALAGVPAVVRTDRDGTVRLDLDPAGRWEIRAHA